MTFQIDPKSPRTHKWLIAGAAAAIIGIAAWIHFSGGAPAEEKPTEVSVSTAPLKRANLRTYVLGYGAVETRPAAGGNPGGGARLAAPVAGIVMGIPVTEGQRVKAGTVIVRLDNRITGATLAKASQALTFAEQQFARQQKLLEIGGTSQKTFQLAQQQLEAARADVGAARGGLAQTELASPVDGVVARINVNPGQTVDATTVVAEIVDLSHLIVTVNVPASEAAAIALGQPAEISRNDASGTVATGSVLFISPSVDVRTDTAIVRIALPPSVSLRPGEMVQARIVSATHTGALAAPAASVVKTDDGEAIYVVRGDKAEQVPVTTGFHDGDLIEVRSPALHDTDTVVTTGAYGLPKSTKIKVVGH